MGICSYDNVTRYRKPLLGQQRMLYPHFTHIVVMADLMPGRKFSHTLTVFRRFYILIRNEMIHNKSYFILVKDLLLFDLVELPYRYRSRNIISQHKIQPGFDKLSGLYKGQAGMLG